MNRFVKAAVLATASAAAMLAPISISAASAGGWGYHYHYWGGGPRWGGPGPYWGGPGPYWRYHRNRNRDAWAAGAIGLAAGAILGSAMSQPAYAAPPPVVYQQPPVVYYSQPQTRVITYERRYVPAPRYGLQPWTKRWYNYCFSRYRSFNPRTGTFLGYDQRYHFCTAN
ncbi:hypothetical protein GCM10011491_36010 [Brucella endophytica]|uniref:Lectin-like protein BA14k n=1 Tax=Brucella endophytica TaxID=1963359 RepID=A0A916SKD8_9HYPH|nr:BA14K family protein [Brucella endophytica]GGB04712.1 hypothetical protein GCM10011491_36010 [Brucella endophytica]